MQTNEVGRTKIEGLALPLSEIPNRECMKSKDMEESRSTGEENGDEGMHEALSPARVCDGEDFVTVRGCGGGAFRWRRRLLTASSDMAELEIRRREIGRFE